MSGSKDRRGFGVLIGSISVLLAVLGVSISTAYMQGGVASETQNFAEGRRALEIGRSCLSEALLDFEIQVNDPGTSWYESTRSKRTSAKGMEHWIVGEYKPVSTLATVSGEDVKVAPVRISVWRDFAIDPDAGPYDEKYALVTLTADVSVRPAGFNPFRGTVRRQLQRSYHVKQTRVTSPQPFGRWTMYVHRVPQLKSARDAYDRIIKGFASRRENLLRLYRQEIDEIIKTLESYLDYMRRKAKDWDSRRKEIKKTEEALDKLIAVTAFSLGLTVPAVIQLQQTIKAMKKELKDDIQKNLNAFNLADEATFRRVGSNPYPPANLRTDIAFELARGSWPTFRGHRATPDGLVFPGHDLDKPVVVEREQVNSREIDYQLPEPPPAPRRPTYSLASRDIQWLDQYANITSEFRRYIREYDQSLSGFLGANAREFKRHEDLFRLLPADLPEYARHLTNLGYQARRASWFFKNQDEFLAHVVGKDGVARLNGIYAIQGDLTKLPARFQGRGHITVEARVSVGTLSRADERSTAVIYAGRDVTVNGSCDAAVLAPAGRLKSRALAQTVPHAVVSHITREDDFTVNYRPEFGAVAAGLQVNVAPAPLAEALLRN